MYVYDVEFAISMIHLEKEIASRGMAYKEGPDEYTIILEQPMPEDLIEKYGAMLPEDH